MEYSPCPAHEVVSPMAVLFMENAGNGMRVLLSAGIIKNTGATKILVNL